MDSLQSLLPKVLRKRGLQAQASASLVTFQAQRWLEKELPAFKEAVKVTTFTDTVLSVSCAHSIAAQECHHLSRALKEFLLQECPSAAVSEIRLLRSRT